MQRKLNPSYQLQLPDMITTPNVIFERTCRLGKSIFPDRPHIRLGASSTMERNVEAYYRGQNAQLRNGQPQ
jgi:hypothetical protein